MNTKYDVAIIGGGPGGSTAATLLKKYAPNMSVAVFEREKFPRDHVGESLLPVINAILAEMGCWDKIEAANFPVKIGATYRWGKTKDLWDFEFVPAGKYDDKPRPGKLEGQRTLTAFQVDRAIYDDILLNHARESGADVFEETKVASIEHEDDNIKALILGDGTRVEAKYVIDASGGGGFLRRALDIPIVEPSALRNIAIWEYWQNADWAVEIGTGGTRIQVMSLGYGWIWFIPIGPTRTSIGLVIPAEYYKNSGMRPEELYRKALEDEPRIKQLLVNAVSENQILTTKDWSFLSERMIGDNWFMIGEAAGFADPILSAGVTLTHVGAREAVYSILEMERGEISPRWLREQFEERQKRRVGHHIRFADYWYTANAQFTELVEFTSEIAKDAGLELDASKAWQWLGTGGFVDEEVGGAGFGGYTLAAAKKIVSEFSDDVLEWRVCKNNVFQLDLAGAKQKQLAVFSEGRIYKAIGYSRNGKTLPEAWVFGFLINTLKQHNRVDRIVHEIDNKFCVQPGVSATPQALFSRALQALEALIDDGWVKASYDPSLPLLDVSAFFGNTQQIHANVDNVNLNIPVES